MTRLDRRLSRRSFGAVLFIVFGLLWAWLAKVHTHSWQKDLNVRLSSLEPGDVVL